MLTTNCEFSNPVPYPNISPPTLPTHHWNFKNLNCSSTDGIFATTTEAGAEQYTLEYKGATSTPFYFRNFWTGADVVIVMLLGFICFITIMTILVKVFLRFKTGIYRKDK